MVQWYWLISRNCTAVVAYHVLKFCHSLIVISFKKQKIGNRPCNMKADENLKWVVLTDLLGPRDSDWKRSWQGSWTLFLEPSPTASRHEARLFGWVPLFVLGACSWWQHHSGSLFLLLALQIAVVCWCLLSKSCPVRNTEVAGFNIWIPVCLKILFINLNHILANLTRPPRFETLGTVGEWVEILVRFEFSEFISYSIAQPSVGDEALNDFGPLAEGLMASYARQTLATQQHWTSILAPFGSLSWWKGESYTKMFNWNQESYMIFLPPLRLNLGFVLSARDDFGRWKLKDVIHLSRSCSSHC